MDWRRLGEVLADEMNHVEQQIMRVCDQKLAALRADVDALRDEVAALRTASGKALRVV